MFALIVSCHNLGVAVSSALGAQLCHYLGCNPRGGNDETEEFRYLWLASLISSTWDTVFFFLWGFFSLGHKRMSFWNVAQSIPDPLSPRFLGHDDLSPDPRN